MSKEVMDFIGKGTAQGEVAGRLLANGKLDVNSMRPWIGQDGHTYMVVHTGGDRKDPKTYKSVRLTANNGTLRKDEWKSLDEAIIPIAEKRLGGVQDLISKGLTYNLGNAMGTTVLESHNISDAFEADLTMDGVSRSKGDRQVFGTTYLPIPIIHVDYEINARVLAASRAMGNSLDTTQAERAARKVWEKLENMLFTDTSYKFGGGNIYSYVNYPDREEVVMSTAWTSFTDDSSGSIGEKIIDDVLKIKQASIDNHFYGPWKLYIPTAYETLLDKDYDNTRGNTIRERILAIAGIEGIMVVDTLSADNVLLVQMTSDVVRLVRGMGIQNVQWETEGRFINKFKVMTIQVPQIRSDNNSKTGIVHLATA